MDSNNVVSIKAHPKFRDVSALRRFLNGEAVSHRGPIDPKDLKMLGDLQEWAAGLATLPNEPVPCRTSRTRDKNTITMRADYKYMTKYEKLPDDA